jgi:hypothetical protein
MAQKYNIDESCFYNKGQEWAMPSITKKMGQYGGWFVFVCVAAIELVLLYRLINEPKVSTELLAAIIIIAGILAISPRIFDITSIQLKAGELNAQLVQVKQQINENKNALTQVQLQLNEASDRINRQFMLTMSKAMYDNLEKIDTGHFGPYEKTQMFMRELYHLRDIGYINVNSIQQIPVRGDDLSLYVSITKVGHDFVRLREELTEALEKKE